ncbi:replication initiator protein [Apis mellifera associated microvirus 32]|nr:replication initiator protein [Apis mellifera associated microvirus 32]
MPCYKPLKAMVTRSPSGGKSTVRFHKGLKLTACEAKHGTATPIPCGQCVGCRLERSRQWAIRLMKELKLHDRSSFLTLTYDDAHLPRLRNGLPTLVLEDIQLFLKRLRKELALPPESLRYFQAGEYGEVTHRPHHHMILFGEDFSRDRVRVADSRSGYAQFESELLTSLWGKGRCTISEVSFESAAYVARYCLKKVTGKGSRFHYRGRKPEFVTMSRRPGIAARYFEEFKSDIYPHDEVVPGPGRPASLPPKYFDKLLEKVDPALFAEIKKKRVEGLDFWSDPNSTDTRLETRERVKESLIKNCLKRSV